MEPLVPPPNANQSEAPALLAFLWVPFPFTVALMCGRIFMRLKMKIMGLDDQTMSVTWVSDL